MSRTAPAPTAPLGWVYVGNGLQDSRELLVGEQDLDEVLLIPTHSATLRLACVLKQHLAEPTPCHVLNLLTLWVAR
jgi:hypothetical protein